MAKPIMEKRTKKWQRLYKAKVEMLAKHSIHPISGVNVQPDKWIRKLIREVTKGTKLCL